jgi:hypothetical protein
MEEKHLCILLTVVFRALTLCSPVGYRRFGGMYGLYLHQTCILLSQLFYNEINKIFLGNETHQFGADSRRFGDINTGLLLRIDAADSLIRSVSL